MWRLAGTMREVSLIVLGMVLWSAPVLATDFTFNSVSDDEIDWNDAANWTPNSIPTITDDATIVSGLLRGAEVHDDQAVHSLVLDSGLNVYRGGTLTVTSTITHNGGYFINDGTVFGNLVENGYLSTTGAFTGDLTNNSVVISENAKGSNAWTGRVLSNTGWILNSYGTWTGDVVSNTGIIENRNGATWKGDVVNDGEIDSVGSAWIGDVHNNAQFIVGGVFIGSIDNTSSLVIADHLRGVMNITNTGNLALDDGDADDTLRARSLLDTGMEVFDLDTSKGRSDRIILSGNYAGTPILSFRVIGGNSRTLADIPVIEVGGVNSATPTPDGLPGDGIISYRLEKKAGDWVIATTLNDAPSHVAGALALADATLVDATEIEPSNACGRGAWARGLGHRASASEFDVDLSGAQLGYDLACVPLTGGATLDLGLTMGMTRGSIASPDVTGSFKGTFAGLYANIIDGAFRAILQGQAGGAQYRVSDPGSLLDAAALNSTTAGFNSTASYALAFGPVNLTPEIGLAGSASTARSTDFGNIGSMSLSGGPQLSGHFGATLAADLPLGNATLTPFLSASMHGNLLPSTTTLIDSAGNSVALPLADNGTYVALALGANLVAAGAVEAGFRTDLKLGATRTDTSFSGHAKVSF